MQSKLTIWAILALVSALETGCGTLQSMGRELLDVEVSEDGTTTATFDPNAAGPAIEEALPDRWSGIGIGGLVTALLGGGASVLSEKRKAEREREARRQGESLLRQQVEDLKTKLAEFQPSSLGIKA
jgi:hypothetical protein